MCPTYNRVLGFQHLLEEAIESFLRQDMNDAELLVGSDCPGLTRTLKDHTPVARKGVVQGIEYADDHYEVTGRTGYPYLVRIINFTQRFPNLGAKYNALAELGQGDMLCSWEDDDIALPWRLRLSLEKIGGMDYYNPRRSWFRNGDGLHHEHPQGYNHNCSLYTRAGFNQVNGYELAMDGSQDASMDGKLKKQVPTVPPDAPWLPLKDWFYIYRWGVSNCHLSAYGGTFYEEWGKQERAQGTYALTPHWETDYLAETREYMAARNL